MKYLKLFAIACCITFLSLSVAAFAVNKHYKAKINADEISITPNSHKFDMGESLPSVSLKPLETISLPFFADGGYYRKVLVDENNNLYVLKTLSHKEKLTNLIKYNIDTKKHTEINPNDNVGDGQLVDYALDDQGSMYGAFQRPNKSGLILVFNPAGKMVKKIETDTFLPFKISIDSSKNIWALGPYLTPFTFNLADTQVRVYNNESLMNIPLGGLQNSGIGKSIVFIDGLNTKIVSHLNHTSYNFVGSKLIEAYDNNFQYIIDRKTSLPNYGLLGVSKFNDNLVWYGVLEEKETPGVFLKSFVALTKSSNEFLTKMVELPTKYRVPMGNDNKGNIYFLSQDSLSLEKVSIEITDHN